MTEDRQTRIQELRNSANRIRQCAYRADSRKDREEERALARKLDDRASALEAEAFGFDITERR